MQRVEARPPGMEPFPFFVHESHDVYISEKIRRRGVWERFETHLMLGLLRPGDQVLDIGANIGWYTVAAARRVGPDGRVFAFEPDARNFSILSANVREGRAVCAQPVRTALGRAAGKAKIRPAADNQGDVRVRGYSSGRDLATDEVPVVALDDYLANETSFQLDRLRILKMDVQGFEWDVLDGARNLLQSLPARTVCFMEFDPALLNECSSESCAGFVSAIEALGRKIYGIGRPIWRLRRMQARDLLAASMGGEEGIGSFDLVIAHASAVADLRNALPLVARLISFTME